MSKKSGEIRVAVREHYKKTVCADGSLTGCCTSTSGCGAASSCSANEIAATLGYSNLDIKTAPNASNLGLGCGNPHALAALKPGETVLDLGSGAGFDCFLAAQQVGATGKVIGVDMTPEMIARARKNALKAKTSNVEFYLGEIEKLPVADHCVDAIISNCVVNLSPDKARVFKEAFRVLKSGGRLSISDIVAIAPLPKVLKDDLTAIASCIGGAEQVETLKQMLKISGFTRIRIALNKTRAQAGQIFNSGENIEKYIASAAIQAIK